MGARAGDEWRARRRSDAGQTSKAAKVPAPSRVSPVLALQSSVGNRAVTRLLARAPVSWEGNVFLPGDANVGQRFTLEGTSIVTGSGRTKHAVGTVAADGAFTLVDESGNAIPGGTGNVSDLVGRVTRKGGTDPGSVSATTGEGKFSVWDDGTEHALTVKDGAVFGTVGKRQELVGDVDVQGHYRVKLDGHVLTGSLTDQYPRQSSTQDVALKRTAGGKVADQFQMAHEPVPEGILIFPEGQYTIKNGQLFRPDSKRAVGSVQIVKSGLGLNRYSVLVQYEEQVTTAGGLTGYIEHYVDVWKSVPAAGSVLRFGNGRSWFVSRGSYWDEMSGGYTKSGYGGYELFGGGRLTPALRGLRTQNKVDLTDDQIDILQGISEVESGGFTQCINTWDSDVVSLGFMQYTLAGSLQELIEMVPDAFARYGIRLGSNLPLRPGGPSVKGIQGVKQMAELRGLEWAIKFYRAGLDPEVIAAQVTKAKAEFASIDTRYLSGVSGIPAFSTPRIKAIIYELYNNRPAYVGGSVAGAAAELKKHPGATLDQVVGFLLDAMETQYVDNNTNGINGPTDAAARQKARDIVARTGQAFPNP